MDPGHAAPFPTPAPGLQTSAGDGGKPYLSLRLLTAFSILPLSYKRGVFLLSLIAQLAYKRVRFIKTYP